MNSTTAQQHNSNNSTTATTATTAQNVQNHNCHKVPAEPERATGLEPATLSLGS
jgi:hypothetical protein